MSSIIGYVHAGETPVKLLLDDHIWDGLTAALTQQDYDVVRVNDTAQQCVASDPERQDDGS